jgi:hypothetical protein
MPNDYLKGQDIQRNGLPPTVNQAQAAASQYVQTNGYASETYKTASTNSLAGGESGQDRAVSAPPPLVYSGPWQYPQINHTSPEAGYQTTSNHHGPVYGGSAVDYREDVPQVPHMGSSMLRSGSYITYQPHVSDQHVDALVQSTGWGDSDTAALWPNTIMMMPQQQHQHQHQQQQPQQQQQ